MGEQSGDTSRNFCRYDTMMLDGEDEDEDGRRQE